MRSTAVLSLLAVAGLSAAQQEYTIVPDSVDQPTREYWCKQQKAQCPLICLQQPDVKTQNTIANDCEWETLDYSCICDNNVSPNVTEYTQTMPYFVCTEWGNQCEKACSDSACASSCRADHPCGAQDPVKPNATASASPSKSSGASPTKSDADGAENTGGLLGGGDDNSSNGNGVAVALGGSFGTMALMLSGALAFAFL